MFVIFRTREVLQFFFFTISPSVDGGSDKHFTVHFYNIL